jgi:hypothetical protein
MDLGRVKSRARPSVPFKLLVVSGEQLAAAHGRIAETSARLRQAILKDDPEKPDRVKELKAAKASQRRAEKQLEECWETIQITALPPDQFEQLKAAHPPTSEDLKNDEGAEWNRDSLRPVLLSACAEGGLSADEWRALLEDRFSKGERAEIFTTALAINESTRVVEQVVLPKGSTGMNGSLWNLR